MRKPEYLENLVLASSESEAESLLREIVRKDPANVVACLKLGDILRNRERYTDALKLHRSLLAQRSPIASAIKKKIYASIIKDYLKADKPKLALGFADDLRKLDRGNIEFLRFLKAVYEELAQWQEAMQLKRRIERLTGESDDRGSAILHAFWGRSLLRESDNREGVKRLREALKLDKFCLPALLFLGDFYYEDGDIDESIKLWVRVVDDLPDYAFLVFDRLKNAYYAKHELSKLESLYVSLLGRNPDNVRVLILISGIYAKKGQDDQAIEALEKAEEVEPQNVIARKGLLKLYYDTKQYDRVLKEGEAIASLVDHKSFTCQKCGSQFVEFDFKCPECKSWLTIR
jgi:lipopolysaccharide biosynthesis regulator YciM